MERERSNLKMKYREMKNVIIDIKKQRKRKKNNSEHRYNQSSKIITQQDKFEDPIWDEAIRQIPSSELQSLNTKPSIQKASHLQNNELSNSSDHRRTLTKKGSEWQ